ncbi:hypothetical protein J6I90_06760 [Pseudidiomarina sp. 1APP75-32.1]|uniref:Uncharacterized protein n=1 Tax=Pseudidiomarina terrestris TaxID=2820060 RepID=A0AAW7R0D2_9GAMM|nr:MULTISPECIES: hypothetical protein [unclassified Pseudidiomarina]MDN7124578.1 hypothetical protein [Pseudidiomarina sp. 1APP75-32.1]MDN7129131.1 hypothetical protein [Pseudidiomarina sp. 1APR75-15]MEA3587607.1 hypothetical protein [Pseudidiomarina sp. 1APP75-27a]
MSKTRKLRKVALYRGSEAIMNYSQHATESTAKILHTVRNEFHRNPGLTHAVVTDRNGREWHLGRNLSRLKLIWLTFRVN